MKKTTNATATKTTSFGAPKRTDMIHLQFGQIVVVPDYNTRKDFGDMESLSRSIAKKGIREAIKVVKVRGEELYMLKSGHRRIKAFQMAIEAGHDMSKFLIPAFVKGNMEDVESDIDLILSNDGKPLTVLEEAYTLDRLRTKHGMTADQIKDEIGRTITHVYDLLTLIDRASDKIRENIEKGHISPSLVISKLRQHTAAELEAIIDTRIEELRGSNDVANVTKKAKITRASLENVADKKYGLTEANLLDLFNIAQTVDANMSDEEKSERISDFLMSIGKKK